MTDDQLSFSSKVVTWALSGIVNRTLNSGWPEPEGLQGRLASGMSGWVFGTVLRARHPLHRPVSRSSMCVVGSGAFWASQALGATWWWQ